MAFLDNGKGEPESYIGGPMVFDDQDFMTNRFVLVTSPIALGRVLVFRNPKNGLWYHQLLTVEFAQPYIVKAPQACTPDLYRQAALEKGAKVAAAHALTLWKTTFTGEQRYRMGHGICPHPRGCGEVNSVGSVWCEWHPGGKIRR